MINEKNPFDPSAHMRKIKSREGDQNYLDVKWRLVWFRRGAHMGSIETQELAYDPEMEVEAEGFAWNPDTRKSERVMKKARGYARYRAIVEDGEGGRATGTKSENAANFPDYGEKAETGAIGRALAIMGFGTQFAPEFNEGERIVDSPVDRPSADTPKTSSETNPTAHSAQPVKGLDEQVRAIQGLLDEYQEAFPDRCNAPKWRLQVLRQALTVPQGEKLPDIYAPDDVLRVEFYVKLQKNEQKASAIRDTA